MDFEKLKKFNGFQFPIVCEIPCWAQAYKVEPEEIERQILLAHGWMQNNPRRAPKKDIMRYLNNWMAIADQQKSMRHGERRKLPDRRAREPEPDMTFEELIMIRKRNFGELR